MPASRFGIFTRIENGWRTGAAGSTHGMLQKHDRCNIVNAVMCNGQVSESKARKGQPGGELLVRGTSSVYTAVCSW